MQLMWTHLQKQSMHYISPQQKQDLPPPKLASTTSSSSRSLELPFLLQHKFMKRNHDSQMIFIKPATDGFRHPLFCLWRVWSVTRVGAKSSSMNKQSSERKMPQEVKPDAAHCTVGILAVPLYQGTWELTYLIAATCGCSSVEHWSIDHNCSQRTLRWVNVSNKNELYWNYYVPSTSQRVLTSSNHYFGKYPKFHSEHLRASPEIVVYEQILTWVEYIFHKDCMHVLLLTFSLAGRSSID
jgi:hypothetical protein